MSSPSSSSSRAVSTEADYRAYHASRCADIIEINRQANAKIEIIAAEFRTLNELKRHLYSRRRPCMRVDTLAATSLKWKHISKEARPIVSQQTPIEKSDRRASCPTCLEAQPHLSRKARIQSQDHCEITRGNVQDASLDYLRLCDFHKVAMWVDHWSSSERERAKEERLRALEENTVRSIKAPLRHRRSHGANRTSIPPIVIPPSYHRQALPLSPLSALKSVTTTNASTGALTMRARYDELTSDDSYTPPPAPRISPKVLPIVSDQIIIGGCGTAIKRKLCDVAEDDAPHRKCARPRTRMEITKLVLTTY
ncbi:hypothetical protein JAAARDRAFT_196366 [Jaapia argillacea MUCL 33604]|uniref:Uncharacterized protein n=1 Tax=Jaapia argillacea MUCL 33604 TaxID=933084 RepID=A0A067PJN8_9AGAM|nr:hypothetical protein JAAARDRAFT_196366 [Jaapia argillacea MUCL 33604]